MSTRISPLSECLYALLRIVAGSMFLVHGVQKVFGVLSEHPKPAFPSQEWFGGWIELVCGTMIALGLFTPAAAFLASGTMAVAYFQYHWKFQMGASFLPTVNQGELAVLYCFVFLYFVTRGSGVWSVDAARRRSSHAF